MKKETIQGHIVRGYDFFKIVQDCPDFEPDIHVYWQRKDNWKLAWLPYLVPYETFYRPMEEGRFYDGRLTLEVGDGVGEPPKYHWAEFEKNIISMDENKLELIGWIVRHVDKLGETLEYFMEYPGDGSLKGSFGPIFGYGTFTFYQIKDMLQDCTPVNKPIPCKMTIERLSGHAERLIMSRE